MKRKNERSLTRDCIRFAFVALLAVFPPTAQADSGSTSMQVRIEIAPIMMIALYGGFQLTSTEAADEGWTIVRAVARYGVTSNVPSASIGLTIGGSIPAGVRVRVLFESRIGESVGWIALRAAQEATVVRDVRGAEYNQAFLEILIPAAVALNQIDLDIALGIR